MILLLLYNLLDTPAGMNLDTWHTIHTGTCWNERIKKRVRESNPIRGSSYIPTARPSSPFPTRYVLPGYHSRHTYDKGFLILVLVYRWSLYFPPQWYQVPAHSLSERQREPLVLLLYTELHAHKATLRITYTSRLSAAVGRLVAAAYQLHVCSPLIRRTAARHPGG